MLALEAAYEETNVVPFDPSFEANLWGIAGQPLWQIGQTLHVNNQSPSASDTNNGSVGSPLKTITKAVALSAPGTRILIYAGTYRESVKVTPAKSGTTLKPLLFEAKDYGKVVVSGSDVVTNWTQDGDRHYAPWTNNWGLYTDDWAIYGAPISELGRRREMIFVDGVFYWQKLDPATLTPGTFAVDEAADRIYIKMADSSAPAAHMIEVTTRNRGMDLGDTWTAAAWASYVAIKGITFQHFEEHSFVGRHVLVEDCKVLWNNNGSSIGGEDYLIRRVTCLYNGKNALSIAPRTTPFDVNGLIENCVTSYGNWRWGNMGGLDGFGMAGMKVMMLNHLIIRGHVAQWNYCPGIWLDNRCNNVLVEDSLSTDNRTNGIWVEINNGETVLRNNIIANNKGGGIVVSNTCYLKIYGNILYNNATQIGNWHPSEDRDGFRTVGLKIKDNVIYGNSSVSLPSGYTSLWNTIEAGGNLYSPTLWTANGRDSTSTAGNPLLRDPTNLDFNVQAGSPLLSNTKWSFVTPGLDALGNLSLTANRTGNPRYTRNSCLPVSSSSAYSTPLDLFWFAGDVNARLYPATAAAADSNYGPPLIYPISGGQANLLANPGFETGSPTGWSGFGCTLTNASLLAHSGAYCARATGRTATWNGPSVILTNKLTRGATYNLSAWVRLESPGSAPLAGAIGQTDGAGTSYHGVGSATVTGNEWTKLEGSFTLNVTGTLTELRLYWSGPATGVVFYIDDAACTLIDPAQAANKNWSAATTDPNWATGGNWGGTAPGAGAPLIFRGAVTTTLNNNLPADLAVGGLTFNSGAAAYTLAGNRITLVGNITDNRIGNETIHLDLILNANRSIIPAANCSLTLGGSVSGAASGLTMAGAGTLTLTGDNSYGGATAVTAGTLQVNGSHTGGASYTVGANGTLGGTGSTTAAVNVSGTLAPGVGSGSATLATGTLTFAANSTLSLNINPSNATADKLVVSGNVATGGRSVNLVLTSLGGAVVLANGAKLVLVDYSGVWPAADLLYLGGQPVADGSAVTLGANTFLVNYRDAALDGTAMTLTVSSVAAWIAANYPALSGADQLPGADPDGDGATNLAEFAFNGDPSRGSNDGLFFTATMDNDLRTAQELSFTCAVRRSTTDFTTAGSAQSATIDGVTYTIEAATTMDGSWSSPVTYLGKADTATPGSTLPDLSGTAWEYRRFSAFSGLPDRGFLRARISQP